MAQLGITVTSNADQAEPGLRRLVATSDAAERAAKRLGASNDNLGRGYDRLKAQAEAAAATLRRFDQATGVSGAVRRSAADIEAYGKELDRLRAKYNPTFAASQAYGRELDGINYAHRVGAISAREQATAIAALDARYRSAAAGADVYQAAASRARADMGATGANALNLGFQAQDIAMMTLMGQAPGMLALQQGMQVGGIFSQMGSGRAIVQGLGSALGMLLNPLNLATIAVIGLGAAGVQAFMAMMGGTEDATTALERHNEWLEKTLGGYEGVRDAADEALEAALKLPEASVASDLSARQSEAAERTVAALEKVISLQSEFEGYARYAEAFGVPDDVAASLAEVSGLISQVSSDASLSSEELNLLHTAFTDLANSTVDQNIKDIANEALALVDAARQSTSEVRSLGAALNALPRDVQIRISTSDVFSGAMSDIRGLYMDPRNQFDRAREELALRSQAAQESAQSMSELTALATDYERVLSSINAAEAAANEKANERESKAAQKPFDQWRTASDNFMQRIEQQRMEIDLMGMGTYEAERQRAAFDLLNQAKQAGVQITEPLLQQINAMSSEYAQVTVQLERMTQAANDNAALWSSAQDGVSGVLKTWARGGDILDTISNKLLNIGDMLIDMAVRNLFQNAFGGGMGFGGGGGGGLLGGMIIPGILHGGGVAGADGYGHGKAYGAALWDNAPRYHNGGIAGLRPNEVPAILQRGEKVIPANQNGGHLDVRVVSEVRNGNLVPVMTEISGQVSGQQIRQAAPVLVGQSVAQANKSAPTAMARFQQQRGGSDYRLM